MLICHLNCFDLHQTIYLLNENKEIKTVGISTVEDLPEIFKALASEYNQNQIRIFGNENIAKKIKEKINAEYNNIIVEVNKKDV